LSISNSLICCNFQACADKFTGFEVRWGEDASEKSRNSAFVSLDGTCCSPFIPKRTGKDRVEETSVLLTVESLNDFPIVGHCEIGFSLNAIIMVCVVKQNKQSSRCKHCSVNLLFFPCEIFLTVTGFILLVSVCLLRCSHWLFCFLLATGRRFLKLIKSLSLNFFCFSSVWPIHRDFVHLLNVTVRLLLQFQICQFHFPSHKNDLTDYIHQESVMNQSHWS
jgi:hypothetical protein